MSGGRREVPRIGEGDGCRGLSVTEEVSIEGLLVFGVVALKAFGVFFPAHRGSIEVLKGPVALLDALAQGEAYGGGVKSLVHELRGLVFQICQPTKEE